MVTSKLNGREIVWEKYRWAYADTKKLIKEERKMTKKNVNVDEVKSIWEKIKGKKWYVIAGVAVVYILCEFVFHIGFPDWVLKLVTGIF